MKQSRAMGTKRLLTVVIVVAFVLGSIVALLFQVGVDEQMIDTVLPRVEDRLDIEITYRDVDASLTGLILEGVEIKPRSNEGLFASIDRLGVGIRVGPLFVGDLDVTGVRLDGLDVRVGSEVGGASLGSWLQLAQNLSAKKKSIATNKVSGSPDIHIASGDVNFDDGRFTASMKGISGRMGEDRRAVIDVEEFSLLHGDVKLVSDGAVDIKYSSGGRAEIRVDGPTIKMPSAGEHLLALLRDGRASMNEFLGASNQSTVESAPDAGLDVPSGMSMLDEVHVIVSEASGSLTDSTDPKKKLSFEAVTVDATRSTGKALSLRASGQMPGSDARWTIGAALNKDGNPRLTIEVPDMSLTEIGKMYLASDQILLNNAFADGTVAVELAHDSRQLTFSGQVALSGVSLNHERIALESIDDLSLHGDFRVTYDRKEGLWRLERFQLSHGLARMTIRGDIHPEKLAFDLFLHVPPTACKQMLLALPVPLRPRLSGVALEGQFGLDMHVALDEKTPQDTILEATLNNKCRITNFGVLPEPNYFRGPFSYIAYTADGEDLRLLSGPGTDRWTPLSLISPFVIEAVLTTEDGKFWRHSGITLPEIRSAIIKNLKKGSLKHGASTITMQLAKNLFLTRERTVARKLQELFLVWHLESSFKKEEILELYLNVVEFGPSIYGIRDAAEHYFGREPEELNAIESVFLIKLLPSPVARHRSYVRGEVSERKMKSLHRTLKTMKDRSRITEMDYAEAIKQNIHFYKEGDPRPEPRETVQLFGAEQPSPQTDTDVNTGESANEEAVWNE
ncbi:MAG: hypothetical protein GY854_10885 [Deltaproteobacteria bacterium]|nr:hypothetical protein [Deltaproteobacteria bacterium]